MATALASLASSSRSVFLECEALRERRSGAERDVVLWRGSHGVVMRCAQEKVEVTVSRRHAACAVIAGAVLLIPGTPAARALLEADDDDSLLEKVKEDKKKLLLKRATAINEFVEESVVQVAVSKLSEAGQAIDGGDFSKASSVFAQQNADRIRNIQAALNKSSDEKAVVDSFRSALSLLLAAVKSGDSNSSRTAFVASAEALDKWTRLTGLSEKVVGL